MIEVRPGGRRRIDRVLAPDYTEGVEQRPLVEVRELRDEAAQEETDLSYLRRLLHARIDIVRAEQERRSSGGSAVVEQLATILSRTLLGLPPVLAGTRPMSRHVPMRINGTSKRSSPTWTSPT